MPEDTPAPQIEDIWGDGDTEWLVCAKITSSGKFLMRCRDSVSKRVPIGTTKNMAPDSIVRQFTLISSAASRAERKAAEQAEAVKEAKAEAKKAKKASKLVFGV